MAEEEAGDGEQRFIIYESLTATLLNESRKRTKRFIKPTCATITLSFPPYLGASLPHLQRDKAHGLDITFKAWASKSKPSKWSQWVQKLQPNYSSTTWEQAGIKNAVLSSLYHTPHNPSFVIPLVTYWCTSSNTFTFPWGEVSITLEDVWVLAGYSVLGDPVSLPLPPESQETLQKLIQFQDKMSQENPQGKEQRIWMDFFTNEETEHELEHVAFLAVWLSRFVFPYKAPTKLVNRDVFTIAVHLSKGTKLALAPAVLAGVYHFLGVLQATVFPLTENDLLHNDDEPKLLGDFELVHHWALARFPKHAPTPLPLEMGQPRAAMWHKRHLLVSKRAIKRHLKWGYDFMVEWRPYVDDPIMWDCVSHYNNCERIVVDGMGTDAELSYGVCLCACELEGFADVPDQKYMPHRVAMQFGIDQHLPGEFAVMKPKRMDKFCFFIPTANYIPSQTEEYHDWVDSSISDS